MENGSSLRVADQRRRGSLDRLTRHRGERIDQGDPPVRQRVVQQRKFRAPQDDRVLITIDQQLNDILEIDGKKEAALYLFSLGVV